MKYATLVTALLYFLCVTPSLADKTPVGVIIFVSGKATATDARKTVRKLKRSAKIYNGDTLTTETNSNLQARFIDGAIVSLREDTILKIGDYEYKSPTKKENSALSLLKGGFRTISGKIGKRHYKVSTNMATIGIRGTHYEAVLREGKLFVAVWHGGVTVGNNAGHINLGMGAAYNFAQVTSTKTTPVGLFTAPPVFQNRNITKAGQQGKKLAQQPRPASPPKPGGNLLAPPPPPPATTVTAQRTLANVNLNRLGVLTYSGANIPNFYGGKSGYDANGNPVITDNTLGPNEVGFYSTPPKTAYWKGTATTISKGSVNYSNGYVVDWGIWDTSSGGSAIRQSDPTGSAIEANVNRNLYWMTVLPTPATTLSSLTGTATYNTSAGLGKGYVIGGSSSGPVNASNFTFTANTNFSTGVVSGSLSISNTDNWNVVFNGDPNNAANGKGLVNGVLDVTADKAASTVQSIYGVKSKFGVVVTGANAQAVAGAFDLEAYNKSTNAAIPTIHAEGVFVAEK